MNDIDWSRLSGATSISCALLGCVMCQGPMIFGGLIFGVLGIVLSPGRGYTIAAIVGLSLNVLRLALFLLDLQSVADAMSGERFN